MKSGGDFASYIDGRMRCPGWRDCERLEGRSRHLSA
ncbi:unnamed protein product [Spirodela intermedia]|uniref:Uncharacterized protein n=1 Tax=Spirodela intermedia TaxID=51605 RepID=A0A7I8JTU3_SPIIN|nr:unnamed protein product [Spirodela intermedia]CAA6673033.1 unnamed protein product [Spirodela intermedia]